MYLELKYNSEEQQNFFWFDIHHWGTEQLISAQSSLESNGTISVALFLTGGC